jgi:selenide,water dikinase
MASKPAQEEAIGWMSTLNRAAAEGVAAVGAHAATDITGFGLVGHLLEIAAASRVTMELSTGKLRFMQEALNYARMGLIPAGAYRNRDYAAAKVVYRSEVEPALSDLVFSPETAGGMLIALDQSQAEALKAELARRNCPAWVIGQVLEPSAGEVVIR